MAIEGPSGTQHEYLEPQPSDKVFFFSDSTLFIPMYHMKAPGDAQESRSPVNTLKAQESFMNAHPGALQGSTVFLSSLSNGTNQTAALLQSITLAKNAGARVIVVGMGAEFDNLNPAVKKMAEDNGAEFTPLGPNSGVHSTDPKGLAERLQTLAAHPVQVADAANIMTDAAPAPVAPSAAPAAPIAETRPAADVAAPAPNVARQPPHPRLPLYHHARSNGARLRHLESEGIHADATDEKTKHLHHHRRKHHPHKHPHHHFYGGLAHHGVVPTNAAAAESENAINSIAVTRRPYGRGLEV